ncbi:MAG TPA: 4-hydroxythreonine-4-phosphate dehydrogenase PdxA [Verrucomicrobia bacterium]|nr:4-hydroxythreonine-4-phosphate dehydrogenase PdxA [Verrucomicrobiota bacterium]
MGDPAGIGPEICARALREAAVLKRCVPVLFGDAEVALRAARLNGRGTKADSWKVFQPKEWERVERIESPAIVDCRAIGAKDFKPGRVSARCGRAAYRYIELAIQSALRGRVAGVVTAPVHKEALHLAGVPYPGHTEIFTALTRSRRSCMMLRSEVITVSMVTTHIGFRDVPEKLSARRVLDVIQLTDEAMRRILGRRPRLGVCGLNPHAGEHGLFGAREEERFVEPAVKRARAKGIDCTGPLVPDAAFTTNQRKRFDAFVTLYHDQGHIPFKMLAFDTGVNITLGLPIVRTSVDHGTAFDIAWKGKADARSLFSAISAAVDLACGRERRAR